MGLRFGKRITIIPGVRLNISKSGVSASVGPRGLSLTAGRRGVHLNAGIPGSGLSYRERLDRPSGSKRTTGAASAFSGPVSISVDDAGALSFTDSAGTPVPPAVVKRIKAEQAADIEALLHRAAEKANRDVEACLGVHLLTPAPDQTPKGLPDFAEPPPRAPQHKAPTLMDRLLLRAGKIERQQMEENARYAEELSDWRVAREAHKVEQASVANAIRLAREGSREGMEDVLAFVLSGIAWPKETLVDYGFSEDLRSVVLEVDLPDEGDTPSTTAEVRTGKLALKKRSDAQIRRDFGALCFGSIFRVAGEAFAALPTIQCCLVSGYIQRPDPATGTIRDDYIISAVIERSGWMRIDFDNLASVDAAQALKALGARCKLDRSARFVPIEPFEMAGSSGQVTA